MTSFDPDVFPRDRDSYAPVLLDDLFREGDGRAVAVTGVVVSVGWKLTRKRELMAVLDIEESGTSVPALIFPRAMQQLRERVGLDLLGKTATVYGRVDVRSYFDELVHIIVADVEAA